MKIDFDESQISGTDYFDSDDAECGLPWCYVCRGAWHILLKTPQGLKPPTSINATPVRDWNEPDGWRWSLRIGSLRFPLRHCCFQPFRPALPEPNTRSLRGAVIYNAFLSRGRCSGASFFGSIEPGMQVWATCQLWLVRESGRKG
jgi:hypothetical protein